MRSIVVVEDYEDNRMLLRAILEDAYEIEEFSNGPEALAALPGLSPDLMLLDISLPEMDGEEVLRRLRADARWEKLPVIALTAHAMASDEQRFLAAGFNAYVAKPIVDEQVLLSAIDRLLAPTG